MRFPFENLPKSLIKSITPLVSVFLLFAAVLQLREEVWMTGAICMILAFVGFIVSIRMLEHTPFTTEDITVLRQWIVPLALWIFIFNLLTLSVFYVADNFKSPETDRIAAVSWIAAVLLALIVVWANLFKSKAILLEKIKTNRVELLIGLSIFIMAFVLRTLDLSNHPYPWSGDEASIGSEARRILSGEITNYFETGWSSQPNWSFMPTAVNEILFGKNIFAVRMASALAGTLAVLFTYLTGREMFNPVIGLMAGAILATLPYHLHFSRVGVANIVDSMFSTLMFWLIVRGIKKDDARYYYSAGTVAGLSIYTYAGTRLVLILAFFTFLFLILRQKKYLVTHWKHLVSFAGGALISAAPQAAFFLRHPDIFLGRFGQEGIFLNGWLASQVAATGKSTGQILFDQFTRTIMVFFATGAPGNFFNSPQPYLTVIGSILFLLGMAYALAYLFEPRYFILLIWFWAVIFFGGILTLNPPANTRLLMTTPVLCLFMTLGAYKLLEYLRRFRIINQRVLVSALVLLVSIISYQNIRFYMFEYRSQMYFQDANGEFAMELAKMTNKLGNNFQVFVLGQPRVFSGFPTLAFIAPNNPRTDLEADSISTLILDPKQNAVFFAIPENRPLLAEISTRYPGGQDGLVYRKPKPGEVLFEYYILSRKN